MSNKIFFYFLLGKSWVFLNFKGDLLDLKKICILKIFERLIRLKILSK